MSRKLVLEGVGSIWLFFVCCVIGAPGVLAEIRPEDPMPIDLSVQIKGASAEEMIAPINPLHPLADTNDPQFKVKYEAYLRQYRERKRGKQQPIIIDEAHPLAND